MESQRPNQSSPVEYVAAVVIIVFLSYPVIVWAKHKIEAKVAADQSVAASLRRIADKVSSQ